MLTTAQGKKLHKLIPQTILMRLKGCVKLKKVRQHGLTHIPQVQSQNAVFLKEIQKKSKFFTLEEVEGIETLNLTVIKI